MWKPLLYTWSQYKKDYPGVNQLTRHERLEIKAKFLEVKRHCNGDYSKKNVMEKMKEMSGSTVATGTVTAWGGIQEGTYILPYNQPLNTSLAHLQVNYTDMVATSTCCQTKAPIKKGKTMYRDCDDYSEGYNTAENQKRYYLRDRASDVFSKKSLELSRKFGLLDEEAPTSFNDLLARVNAGQYVIKKEDADQKFYSIRCIFDRLRWRDPAKVEDTAGNEKAQAALKTEYTKLVDQIKISDPATALTALQAFETWTYTA